MMKTAVIYTISIPDRDVTPLVDKIGIGTLYSTLKQLRAKGLIYSLPGEAIAGGARKQYYFAKEV
jgi:DNA-binding PadR family transcriptional regulator